MSPSDSTVYLIGTFASYEGKDDENPAMKAGLSLLKMHANLPIARPITLCISSGGGLSELGLALQGIVSSIRRDGRIVNAHVIGYAMSSALYLLQYCDERTAEKSAVFMLHETQVQLGEVNSAVLLIEGKFCKKMEKTQLELFAQRTGKSVAYYQRKTDAKDWYLTAEEALEEGLIDRILPATEFRKTPDPPPRKRRSAKLTD